MDKKYAYWLCSLPGIGDRAIRQLLEVCGGTPEEVYRSGEKRWKEVLRARQVENMKQATADWNLEERYAGLQQQGIGFCTFAEACYPGRLRKIPDPPYGLYYIGRLPEENKISVAVVGARDCSGYGSCVAAGLGNYLGGKGVQIISGMARGIDGISQMAALEAGGTSYGVLGCGVDVCYPTGNRKLYERLQKQGGVLSAYSPGTLAKAGHFPPRNRIVSGLADAVVVIEARQKSGTLITVDMALEQGKEVYVVPGRITDRLSDGCNHLIKQGAGILLSFPEFFEELQGLFYQETEVEAGKHEEDVSLVKKEPSVLQMLPELSRKVYKVLDFYPQSIAQILDKLSGKKDYIRVSTACQQLCMEGLAVSISPGFFSRKEEKNSILL